MKFLQLQDLQNQRSCGKRIRHLSFEVCGPFMYNNKHLLILLPHFYLFNHKRVVICRLSFVFCKFGCLFSDHVPGAQEGGIYSAGLLLIAQPDETDTPRLAQRSHKQGRPRDIYNNARKLEGRCAAPNTNDERLVG